MRILIYGLNYAPELTGVGKYTGETVSWLSSQGHDVHVVTAPPYYPGWKVQTGYTNTYQIERPDRHGDPTVYRCPIWVKKKPSGVERLVHLGSFALSSLPILVRQVPWRPDLVFVVEPTFFTAPAGLLLAALIGAKAWLHIQDFEVDAAFDITGLSSGFQHVAKMLEGIFTRLFSRVSTISEKMRDQTAARGVSKGDAVLFPNWCDVEEIRPDPAGADNYYRSKYSLEGKIVLLYSGTMAKKQGVDMLAPLAESFAHDPRVHFVFCGEGACELELQRLVTHCRNVTMLQLQPEDLRNALLNLADIHLLPQDRNVRDLAMPSRLTGMLSSGRPVLAVAEKDTEVANVVEGKGLVVPPCDPAAMYAAARRLVDDPELRVRLGQAGREYAVKHVNKEDILRRFERDIVALLATRMDSEEIPLAQGVSRLNRG